MAYSDFTLKDAVHRFALTLDAAPDLFGSAPAVAASPWLQQVLERTIPLARALYSEKSRSEYIVAPVLLEVRSLLGDRISLFSGVDFPVAPELGLTGICDFILSRSPQQYFIEVPVAVVVEAKKDNIPSGLGQCVATMVAARLFNEREGASVATIYGAVTTGVSWQFLELQGHSVRLEEWQHDIEHLDRILGILRSFFDDTGRPEQAAA